MMNNVSTALEYAEDSLKADPEVVKIAEAQESVVWLSRKRVEPVRKGIEQKVCMMNNMSSALEYAEDSLKADPEVVKIAVAQERCALEYAQADPEVVRIAVAKNGIALRYAAELLKADPEVVKIVVAKDGLALEHAAESLKAD